MVGIGLGFRGLGMGGIKRPRRYIRSALQRVSRGDVRRLARRGGVKRIHGSQ